MNRLNHKMLIVIYGYEEVPCKSRLHVYIFNRKHSYHIPSKNCIEIYSFLRIIKESGRNVDCSARDRNQQHEKRTETQQE